MTSRSSWTAAAAGVIALASVALVRAFAWESTVEVDLAGNRFDPGEVTIHPGDSLAFVNVGGGMHNIAFREDVLSAQQRSLLDAAMPEREAMKAADGEAPLASPILVSKDEVYGFRIPKDLPPGRYEFFCAPHVAAGMKGVLVVAP